MEKTGLNWWSDRAWIKSGCILTAVMTAVILVKWESWTDELKIIGAVGALVPVHVLEEWGFPGWFHYQYNILQKSSRPDRYPMCSVPASIMAAALLFCVSEVVSHTAAGIKMHKRFKPCGKTTIYGPGFLVLGVLSFYSLRKLPVSGLDVLIGIALPVVSVIVFIVLPENLLKDEDSPYYERFLTK